MLDPPACGFKVINKIRHAFMERYEAINGGHFLVNSYKRCVQAHLGGLGMLDFKLIASALKSQDEWT